MKKLIFGAICALSLSQAAMAVGVSMSKSEFCSDREDRHYARELLQDNENMLAFTNHGGLINGGVCWWHSRFTRNAAYLAIYRPELPRPSADEARRIIKEIRKGDNLVVIPGYANLKEFSSYSAFASLIQDELERWQRGDGLIRQQWIVGLAGRSSTSAEKMKSIMDELYNYVEVQGNVAYQKLQLPGVVAHAWLVVGMEKTRDGYDLTVVDSNYRNPYTVSYYEGMTHLNYSGFGNFVPYLERERELSSVKRVIQKNCR